MDSSLVDELREHRIIGTIPDQLAWIADVGHLITVAPGEVLTPSTGPVKGLYIVLDGYLSIRVDRGAGPRIVMEWRGGDVTGLLPYSRLKAPPGNVVAEERTRIVMVDTVDLPRMIRECHELTAVLVHVMVDRARVFKSSELLDEKMVSLGRLAAGLAHELNNPASAVARSAKTLLAELAHLEDTTKRFCTLSLSDEQRRSIARLLDDTPPSHAATSPIELADRQDALDDWFAAHGVDPIDPQPLVESGMTPKELDTLNALVGPDDLPTALGYVAAGQTVRQLVAEIDIAASRIYSLVSAVKGFTYVNQQATLQPIAIARGLEDTVTVLRSKARSKSVDVTIRATADLPTVEGYGGELNQVWANLLDNAIDASPGGQVRVEADAGDGQVVVRVIDNGPGIPAEVEKRIFNPFFTTKDVGQGTGLGLDIARRIVQRHHGVIDVDSRPGRTEFRVTLPAMPVRT